MRFFTLIFLSLVLFSACSQDENIIPDETVIPDETDPNDSECAAGCMTALVNGAEFEAVTTTATLTSFPIILDTTSFETSQLFITGTIPSVFGANKTISLVFACSELGFAISLSEISPECGLDFQYGELSFLDPTATLTVLATDGNLLIEEFDNGRIKGTFNFVGEDENGVEFSITDGTFDALYL